MAASSVSTPTCRNGLGSRSCNATASVDFPTLDAPLSTITVGSASVAMVATMLHPVFVGPGRRWPGDVLGGQVRPYRFAVMAQVPGDRRHRPPGGFTAWTSTSESRCRSRPGLCGCRLTATGLLPQDARVEQKPWSKICP